MATTLYCFDGSDDALAEKLRTSVHPLTGAIDQYDPLLDLVDDARFVLLGEASHGTHDFYRERIQITKRLILERGFTTVAVEADWPHAYRVHRYVQGLGGDTDAVEALDGFRRFPTWMWRNADVLDFVGWLRSQNDARAEAHKLGVFGLDLYSLHDSMAAVLDFLQNVDPEAARRARHRYACFDHFGEDTQAYGYATGFGLSRSCEQEVVNQLVELRQRRARALPTDADGWFYAEQNARLVRNAEEYYRTMFLGRVSSWNLRDQHMMETLEALDAHLGRDERSPKIVVWAHNSHLGDARATDMGRLGELNVGQLVRERYGSSVAAVGFTTYTGTVTAASDWDAPAERKQVRPALAGSYEALFHAVGIPRFLVSLREPGTAADVLGTPRLERAIGVVYKPETELQSHYFHATLPAQFDAILHFDETRAVEPLERTSDWETGEAPETYPTGM